MGKRKEERGKRKEERGKRKEERGKRKEERGKRKEEREGGERRICLFPEIESWKKQGKKSFLVE